MKPIADCYTENQSVRIRAKRFVSYERDEDRCIKADGCDGQKRIYSSYDITDLVTDDVCGFQ